MKAGDLVRLKSGGPLMTVSHEENGNIVCKWFDGKKIKQWDWPPACLVEADASTE